MEKVEVNPAFWKGKRVLVTGNTGFKGSWLSVWLSMMGAEVFGYSKGLPSDPCLWRLGNLRYLARDVSLYDHTNCEIRDREQLRATMRLVKPDIVIHLAAQPIVLASYEDPESTIMVNAMGTMNLMEVCREVCPKVVLNVTTDKVYRNDEGCRAFTEDDPLGGNDPYSASKACSEIITHSYYKSFLEKKGIRVATARAGNVIGGGDYASRLVPDCIRAFQKGEPVVIRNPNSIRPWQHVLDALAGYIILCERLWDNPELCGAWNFAPDIELAAVGEVVTEVAKGWPGAQVSVQQDESGKEAVNLALNNSKAKHNLGWHPKMNALQAARKTVEWAKENEGKRNYLGMCQRQIEEYMGMTKGKVAILGATGHLGKSLAWKFWDEKWVVDTFARSMGNLELPMEKEYDIVVDCIGSGKPSTTKDYNEQSMQEELRWFRMMDSYANSHPKCHCFCFSSGVACNAYYDESIYATCKRSLEAQAHDNVYAIRLFSYISEFIDLDGGFLVTEMVRALKAGETFKTPINRVLRDYLGPDDIYHVIVGSREGRMDNVLKPATLYPTDKFSILSMMKARYPGFEFEATEYAKDSVYIPIESNVLSSRSSLLTVEQAIKKIMEKQ